MHVLLSLMMKFTEIPNNKASLKRRCLVSYTFDKQFRPTNKDEEPTHLSLESCWNNIKVKKRGNKN